MDAADDLAVPPSRARPPTTTPSRAQSRRRTLQAAMSRSSICAVAMAYRNAHIAGAQWSIRPRLLSAVSAPSSQAVVLIGSDDVVALAARDLAKAGHNKINRLAGEIDDWRAAGLRHRRNARPAGRRGLHRLPVLHCRTPQRQRGRLTAISRMGDRPRRSARRPGAQRVSDRDAVVRWAVKVHTTAPAHPFRTAASQAALMLDRCT